MAKGKKKTADEGLSQLHWVQRHKLVEALDKILKEKRFSSEELKNEKKDLELLRDLTPEDLIKDASAWEGKASKDFACKIIQTAKEAEEKGQNSLWWNEQRNDVHKAAEFVIRNEKYSSKTLKKKNGHVKVSRPRRVLEQAGMEVNEANVVLAEKTLENKEIKSLLDKKIEETAVKKKNSKQQQLPKPNKASTTKSRKETMEEEQPRPPGTSWQRRDSWGMDYGKRFSRWDNPYYGGYDQQSQHYDWGGYNNSASNFYSHQGGHYQNNPPPFNQHPYQFQFPPPGFHPYAQQRHKSPHTPSKPFSTNSSQKPLPSAATKPRLSAQELEERARALREARKKKNEDILEAQKEASKYLERKNKVELLKEKLKNQAPGATSPLPETEDDEEATKKEKVSGTAMTRHLNSDLFLSQDDFKDIGTGRVVEKEVDSAEEFQMPNSFAVYAKKHVEAEDSGASTSRVANTPAWDKVDWSIHDKNKRQRSHSESNGDELVRKRPRRTSMVNLSDEEPDEPAPNPFQEEQYKRMAKNLKKTILKKDKHYLHKLINCPSNMKKILMRDLLNEHQSSVTKKLTTLRFNQREKKESEEDGDKVEETLSEIARLEDESINQVDIDALPVNFMETITALIKDDERTEQPTDENVQDGAEEDIVEVPVPPKPPAPLIEIEEEDENDGDATGQAPETESSQQASPGAAEASSAVTPMEQLLVLTEEERDLQSELRALQDRQAEIMGRMDYIRELRCQIIMRATDER